MVNNEECGAEVIQVDDDAAIVFLSLCDEKANQEVKNKKTKEH